MNQKLTDMIVQHIFSNLGVNRISNHLGASIMDKKFLTKHTIDFKDSHGRAEKAKVWACQTVVNNSKFRIMFSNLECDHSDYVEQDAVMVIKLDGCPTYGCSLIIWDSQDVNCGFIACQIKDNAWMQATTYIQATFLAGMEQLKDLSSGYDKCDNTEDLITNIKEYIIYRETFIEDEEDDARKED